MQPDTYLVDLTTQTYTDTDREGFRMLNAECRMCVCVCVCVRVYLPLQCFCTAVTYPVQSFGLYVPQELLPPIGRHPGGDVLGLLRDDRPYFDGVV